MRLRLLIGAVLASLPIIALAAPGCYWESVADLGSNCAPGTPVACCPCPWPEACPDGAPPLPPQCLDAGDEDGGADANDAMTAICHDGTCAKPPAEWAPVQLAVGLAINLPECPSSAPEVAFEGMPEPSSTPSCPTCSCDEPLGSCSLPSSWIVDSTPCLNGGVKTNFDPPAGWDGTCSPDDSIAPGKLCGADPCVAGINISPPVVTEQPCTPHSSEEPHPPVKFVPDGPFDTVGRACSRDPWPTCPTPGEACLPNPRSDFATCVMHDGDLACPEGFPERHLLYGQVDDQRTCSACSCSPPSGAICSVHAHVYADTTCSTVAPLDVVVSNDMGQNCYPLMIGVGLAGKAAELLAYKPGSCTPNGGELVGEVVLGEAKTFCCLEAPTI